MRWIRAKVDLIGSLVTVHSENGKFDLLPLTMIDQAKGWFEVVSTKDKHAGTVAAVVNDTQLSRCPSPQLTGFDAGMEKVLALE